MQIHHPSTGIHTAHIFLLEDEMRDLYRTLAFAKAAGTGHEYPVVEQVRLALAKELGIEPAPPPEDDE